MVSLILGFVKVEDLFVFFLFLCVGKFDEEEIRFVFWVIVVFLERFVDRIDFFGRYDLFDFWEVFDFVLFNLEEFLR